MFAPLRSRNSFRRTAWLAVLAMLLPVLLPALHHPGAGLSPAAYLHLHICSAAGKSGDAGHGQKDSGTKPACPLCHSLHLTGHGLEPAASSFVRLSLPPVLVMTPRRLAVIAAYRPPPAAQPRAPPTFA